MKSQRQAHSLMLAAAATILVLLGSVGAAAQESRHANAPMPTTSTANSESSAASSPNARILPGRPEAREEVTAARSMEASSFSTAGSRLFSIPHFVAREWEVAGATTGPSVQQPRGDASSTLSVEQKEKKELRPVSNFPQGASPTMFPGSLMRSPFQQTYPRPFPGGGQP